jgi:acylphosphatase
MTVREDPGTAGTGPVRMTAWVRGRVQQVGFRWWVRARALELGLVGSATNLADGRVEIAVQGDRNSCETLLDLLREQPARGRPEDAPASWLTRPGAVTGVVWRWSPARDAVSGFVER